MDLTSLRGLGKVAGVPGIALGVGLLLMSAVVAATDITPEAWRGQILTAVVASGTLLALAGVIGWMRTNQGNKQTGETTGKNSPVKNIIKSKSGGVQRGRTLGDNSRVDNVQ